jgi:hypothetical protein|uniref:hypothetical protein n=1 Tax=Alloprevotella sp. TaxID=1872471 RepID=UPI0040278473
MKRIYKRPESIIIRMSSEASMMTTISRCDNGSNNDGWSNHREWSESEISFGDEGE